MDGRFYADNVDRLATSALDVCQKAEESGTDRGKTNVYRTNADHRLMAFGLFSGFGDHVSLYRRRTTPDEAYIDEARQFYSWAGAYHEVLGHMAAHHMDLMERLSPGQTWHLEHEAHEAALPQIEAQALDHMLDAYNRWRVEPNETTRKQVLEASTPYTELKSGFDPKDLMN